MRRSAERALFGMRVGMELCWRYAWAEYTIGSILDRPFPLPQAAGALVAAAALTGLVRGRGWRVLGVLLLQALGLGAACLLVVHGLYRPPPPWWDVHWVGAFFGQPRAPEAVLVLGLVLFWGVVFWAGGVTVARRPSTYLAVCTRFDLGTAAFLGLFLVRWLVRVQGGIETGGALPELLLFPYFVFGLFAVGLARNRGQGQKDFLAGHRGIGVVAGVLLSVLFLGAAVAVLFLPYLTAAAEAGYGVLRAAAAPFGPVLLGILRFLLTGRWGSSLPGAGGQSGSGPGAGLPPSPQSWWEHLLGQVFAWGLGGLLAGLALAVAGIAAWHLLRWLLSRTSGDRPRRGPWGGLLLRMAEAWARLKALAARLGRQAPVRAAELYAALRAWGARSGLAPHPAETPSEYGNRLRHRFPAVEAEIGELVALFNGEVYGEQPLEAKQLAGGRRARSRLRSPRLWPARLRSWLLRSDPLRVGL